MNSTQRAWRNGMLSVASAVALATVQGGGVAHAVPIVFFGQDLNTVEAQRLTAHPNSDAARTAFLANLIGVGTETFEATPNLTLAPLPLTFPGAGTATLTGDGIVLDLDALGLSAPLTLAGRYPISGMKHWDAGDVFSVGFSSPVAAFGFYGSDIGDFGGQVTLTLKGAADVVLTVPSVINGVGGSVLYFGVIDTENPFTSLTFGNTAVGFDSFGFDDMTIGSLAQVVTSPPPPQSVPEIPEPSTGLLMATGVAGLRMLQRVRETRK